MHDTMTPVRISRREVADIPINLSDWLNRISKETGVPKKAIQTEALKRLRDQVDQNKGALTLTVHAADALQKAS